jgi:hypothetical protein
MGVLRIGGGNYVGEKPGRQEILEKGKICVGRDFE